MKIDDLLQQLNDIKDQHGNVDVLVQPETMDYLNDIDFVGAEDESCEPEGVRGIVYCTFKR